MEVNEEIKLFNAKEAELTIEKGCILWGMRVFIPKSLQEKILSEIDSGHQGILRMKQVARSYVWWKNIDKEIEQNAKQCDGCTEKRSEPPKSKLHPWEYPKVILDKDFISISQDQSTTNLTLQ